jgi:hypothetical protein
LLFATRFAPDDLFQRVIAEFSRKSAPHAKFNAAREAKKSGAARSWRSLICVNTSMATDQRPKNSQGSDLKKRVAVVIDGVANFGIDVAGLAGAGKPPFVSGCAGRKRRIR